MKNIKLSFYGISTNSNRAQATLTDKNIPFDVEPNGDINLPIPIGISQTAFNELMDVIKELL